MALLEVKNLGILFGGLRAVDEFNVSIEKGELYGLIGPNGAGKTTVFNMLTGVYKPSKGVITLDGENITGKSTRDINRAGIARTFQNIRLFKEMSVLDNVKVGLHNHYKYSTAEGVFRLPRFFSTEKEMDKKAMELLHVFELDDKADFLASNLPYICSLSCNTGFGTLFCCLGTLLIDFIRPLSNLCQQCYLIAQNLCKACMNRSFFYIFAIGNGHNTGSKHRCQRNMVRIDTDFSFCCIEFYHGCFPGIKDSLRGNDFYLKCFLLVCHGFTPYFIRARTSSILPAFRK